MRYVVLGLLLFVLGSSFAQDNMRIHNAADPFDDSDRSQLIVKAVEQPYLGSRLNAIVWLCRGASDYDLAVVNEEYLGGDRVPVIFRFDEGEAQSRRWIESTNGLAAFAPEGQEASFTRAALESNRVAIGLTNYRGQRHSYDFNLVGLRSSLTNLGCVGIAPELPDVYTEMGFADAYEHLMEVVGSETFTEGTNVVYFNNLTVHFMEYQGTAKLSFEGSDEELYERIRNAFN